MAEAKNTVNILIGALIVLAIGLSIYYFYPRGESAEVPATGITGENPFLVGGEISQEALLSGNLTSAQLINLINQIRDIKLNNAFFDSPAFLGLEDRRLDLVPEAAGTANPFVDIF